MECTAMDGDSSTLKSMKTALEKQSVGRLQKFRKCPDLFHHGRLFRDVIKAIVKLFRAPWKSPKPNEKKFKRKIVSDGQTAHLVQSFKSSVTKSRAGCGPTSDFEQVAKLMAANILIGLEHSFGNHSGCDSKCNGKGPGHSDTSIDESLYITDDNPDFKRAILGAFMLYGNYQACVAMAPDITTTLNESRNRLARTTAPKEGFYCYSDQYPARNGLANMRWNEGLRSMSHSMYDRLHLPISKHFQLKALSVCDQYKFDGQKSRSSTMSVMKRRMKSIMAVHRTKISKLINPELSKNTYKSGMEQPRKSRSKPSRKKRLPKGVTTAEFDGPPQIQNSLRVDSDFGPTLSDWTDSDADTTMVDATQSSKADTSLFPSTMSHKPRSLANSQRFSAPPPPPEEIDPNRNVSTPLMKCGRYASTPIINLCVPDSDNVPARSTDSDNDIPYGKRELKSPKSTSQESSYVPSRTFDTPTDKNSSTAVSYREISPLFSRRLSFSASQSSSVKSTMSHEHSDNSRKVLGELNHNMSLSAARLVSVKKRKLANVSRNSVFKRARWNPKQLSLTNSLKSRKSDMYVQLESGELVKLTASQKQNLKWRCRRCDKIMRFDARKKHSRNIHRTLPDGDILISIDM
eukprot:789325_1